MCTAKSLQDENLCRVRLNTLNTTVAIKELPSYKTDPIRRKIVESVQPLQRGFGIYWGLKLITVQTWAKAIKGEMFDININGLKSHSSQSENRFILLLKTKKRKEGVCVTQQPRTLGEGRPLTPVASLLYRSLWKCLCEWWRYDNVSVCCLRLCSLLLLVQDDADDVALVLLHVLHQPLLAGGLKATDAAAEQQHAVLHGGPWGELACARMGLGRVLIFGGNRGGF